MQAEGLAYLHTSDLRIQFCNVGYECLGSLIANHDRPYWVGNKIGFRTRKSGAVYANLHNINGGLIGSNTTFGLDLGEASGLNFTGVDIEGNGTSLNLATGALRIRDTVDNETGFSEIQFNGCWFEGNGGSNFNCESAGGLYLTLTNTKLTGNEADACKVGTIASFVWINSEAVGSFASDTLTVSADQCTLIGGIVYALADTSALKTYINFRTSTRSYSNWANGYMLGGNLVGDVGATTKILGGGNPYAENAHILTIQDRFQTSNPASFYSTSSAPGNAAACSFRVGASTTTSRSINAGGTVNANGADYAEYETKRSDCGVIEKGAIVGYDAAGLLTDRWALACTFGIKSTNPSIVGGDDWGSGLITGPDGQLSPEDALELERRRALVDRIAYAGKVPANITAAVGDYVVPTEGAGGSITALGVADPTPEQYRASIGQVRAIGADGRPIVTVKVS